MEDRTQNGVRSYRHARRSATKSRVASVITLSAPQWSFAIVGGVAGAVAGWLLSGPSAAGGGVIAGVLTGIWLGSKRTDGRNPFQWLNAARGRRRGVWSPRWGRITPTVRLIRWTCMTDETGNGETDR